MVIGSIGGVTKNGRLGVCGPMTWSYQVADLLSYYGNLRVWFLIG